MLEMTDKRAPATSTTPVSTATTSYITMSSAPMKFRPDGGVDWGNMWDTFCILAQDGGPPHRGTMLQAPENPDPYHPDYEFALHEIIRGIWEVSGLSAQAANPGWVSVTCASPEMARWLFDAIQQENVCARCERSRLFLPVGGHFTLKGEIKNVITVVAKTTHYWQAHVSQDVKRVLAIEEKFGEIKAQLKTWFG